MSTHKLVPVEPKPEMVRAAEDAYVSFGDMEMAIRLALLAAPDHIADARKMVAAAAQGEPVAAQYRFRHPQRLAQNWSVWQPASISLDRPSREIDSQGYEVEYRLLYDAPQPAEQQPEPAKYQPCGCVICACEHETQCQGCGAKHCGTHPVGQLPAPAYIQPAEQQPDPFRGDNAALIRSAQSLLRLDDKGAFGPNGIGGHARNIITAFIARISADQQPQPDVSAMVEALEQYADDHNWCYDTCDIGRDVAKKALAARRKRGGA